MFKRKKYRDPFEYNRFLEPICRIITHHRPHRLIAWDESFRKGGCKYPNRHDLYYKCKICGYVFFNHHVSEKDLQYIKEFEEERLGKLDAKE